MRPSSSLTSGMNLSASERTVPSGPTGTPRRASGPKRRTHASLNCVPDVEDATHSEKPTRSRMRRTAVRPRSPPAGSMPTGPRNVIEARPSQESRLATRVKETHARIAQLRTGRRGCHAQREAHEKQDAQDGRQAAQPSRGIDAHGPDERDRSAAIARDEVGDEGEGEDERDRPHASEDRGQADAGCPQAVAEHREPRDEHDRGARGEHTDSGEDEQGDLDSRIKPCRRGIRRVCAEGAQIPSRGLLRGRASIDAKTDGADGLRAI